MDEFPFRKISKRLDVSSVIVIYLLQVIRMAHSLPVRVVSRTSAGVFVVPHSYRGPWGGEFMPQHKFDALVQEHSLSWHEVREIDLARQIRRASAKQRDSLSRSEVRIAKRGAPESKAMEGLASYPRVLKPSKPERPFLTVLNDKGEWEPVLTRSGRKMYT